MYKTFIDKIVLRPCKFAIAFGQSQVGSFPSFFISSSSLLSPSRLFDVMIREAPSKANLFATAEPIAVFALQNKADLLCLGRFLLC